VFAFRTCLFRYVKALDDFVGLLWRMLYSLSDEASEIFVSVMIFHFIIGLEEILNPIPV